MKHLIHVIYSRLQTFIFYYYSRKELLALDSIALQDIGLTVAEVKTEGEKPFWQGDAYLSQQSKVLVRGCVDPQMVNSSELVR